ncbi:MAG TPA: hypothetical protein VJH03_03620 [Blastocatellia bacterium]|nr:hypothetical protein [Blastocatellia bacterium]
MADRRWSKPEIHEALVVLYLRLNGYFTTGLVVHASEWGQNQTEIDCLAVRHPNHMQPERTIGPSPFLAIGDGRVDLLLCEVKSVAADVGFNERLWSDAAVLDSVLQWAGVFANDEIARVAAQLRPILKEGLSATRAQDGVVSAGARARGLLCCPPATEKELDSGWCLLGSEILHYANECFNPSARRNSCSTRYNFKLWGRWLAPLVEYFKSVKAGASPSLTELYGCLGAAEPPVAADAPEAARP